MNILEIRNLNKSFPKIEDKKKVRKQVLRNINLEIKENESLGIIGNSGSGKTTLIKILFNLEKADSGVISFKNENILDLPTKKKQKLYSNMGYVMQDPYSSLCPYMTVKEIIAEPIKLHKIETNEDKIEKYIENLLDKVHLNPHTYMNKYPKELSGGERQRVAIARSISTRPSFLVLDEPTSMIDASSKDGVLSLLDELKREYNLSIVMISHDISTVLNNCDNIAVMKHGEIIEYDSSKNIQTKPKENYTKELILASKDLTKYWDYLEGISK